jgi:hypothetical protein
LDRLRSHFSVQSKAIYFTGLSILSESPLRALSATHILFWTTTGTAVLQSVLLSVLLPATSLVAVNTYINSNNRRQAAQLFVHPMHHNSTAVQHLSNHSMIRRPDRSTLVAAPLVYPPCKTTVIVKYPRSSNGRRYHAHGEQPTASSQLPCQQRTTHPDIIAAQQRLASMNCNGPDLLIVLHRQRNRSRSTFPQASNTADAITESELP